MKELEILVAGFCIGISARFTVISLVRGLRFRALVNGLAAAVNVYILIRILSN